MQEWPDSEDQVELSGGVQAAPGGGETAAGRPFLRVYFACANRYTRVYRNAEGTRYDARCPQCGQCKRFAVGPGGSAERFFQVTCR